MLDIFTISCYTVTSVTIVILIFFRRSEMLARDLESNQVFFLKHISFRGVCENYHDVLAVKTGEGVRGETTALTVNNSIGYYRNGIEFCIQGSTVVELKEMTSKEAYDLIEGFEPFVGCG